MNPPDLDLSGPLDPAFLKEVSERLAREGPRPWRPSTVAELLMTFEFHPDVLAALDMFVSAKFDDETQMPLTAEGVEAACRYVDEHGTWLHSDETITNAYTAMAGGKIPFPYLPEFGPSPHTKKTYPYRMPEG